MSTKEKSVPRQDFNYHTHTFRCGHAKPDGLDEDYVKAAIACGMTKIAFTDHIPLPNNNFPNSRMDMNEITNYLLSIKELQERYKNQLEIESGFEFEYYSRAKEHFFQMRELVDKMIIGQHFVIDDKNIETRIYRQNGLPISDDVLRLYLDRIQEAIELGLVDIIAHPDLFMQARDRFDILEETITKKLCELAIKYNIPLEINMGKIFTNMNVEIQNNKFAYPNYNFWSVVANETKNAAQKGKMLKVIYGKDSHFPEDLESEVCYKYSDSILGEELLGQLIFVDKSLEKKQEVKRLIKK